MKSTSSKDKRVNIRIPLLSEKCFIGPTEIPVDMTDITETGIFVKFSDINKLELKGPIDVKLCLPGDLGSINVSAKVARVKWHVLKKEKDQHKGLGIQFTEDRPNIQKILAAYVVYLRNKQIITVSKRIIEEFFGNKEPHV